MRRSTTLMPLSIGLLAAAVAGMGVVVDFFGPDAFGAFGVLSEGQVVLLAVMSTVLAGVVAALVTEATARHVRIDRARRVFIIYSRKDVETAKQIAEVLREHGMEPWLDVEKLAAGEVWKDVAAQALADSAMAIVIVTPNFLDSNFAAAELKIALSRLESRDPQASPLIPVIAPNAAVPNDLAHIQYVDMSSPEWPSYLVKSVKNSLERIL